MGQDLYVGSLARYYAHDWETPAQRFAREHRTQYVRIGPADARDAVTDPATIRRVVADWKEGIGAALIPYVTGPFEWDERSDAPYVCEQLPATVLDGLRVAAACHEHLDIAWPDSVPQDCWAHEALQRVMNDEDEFRSRFEQLIRPRIWLPVDFEITVDGPTPAGAVVTFGSSCELLRELQELNNERYHGTPEDFARWRSESDGGGTLDDYARRGLALLSDFTALSIEQRLPMLLDF